MPLGNPVDDLPGATPDGRRHVRRRYQIRGLLEAAGSQVMRVSSSAR